MLKSWSIKNFKPIVDSGELQLAPVTILAGRNSSGKSSLLQSILMIAQTLGSRLSNQPLLTNDRLTRLGTFDNILSEIVNSRTLEFQFGLVMEDEEIERSSRLRAINRWNIKSANFFAKFNSATSDGIASSAIEASKIVVEHVRLEVDTELITWISFEQTEHRKTPISFDLQKISDDDMQRFLENVLPEQRRLVSPTSENSNYLGHFEQSEESILQENVTDQYLVALSHFLPAKFTAKYNIGKRRKEIIEGYIDLLFESGERFFEMNKRSASTIAGRFIKSIDLESLISEKQKDAIKVLCEKNKVADNFSGGTLRDLVRWTRTIRRKKKMFDEIRELVVQEYSDDKDDAQEKFEGLESTVNNIYLDNLEQVIEQITSFFTSKIRYLGPLRADPGTIQQQFSPTGELDNVGIQGEYAAIVYHTNKNALINWYNPQTQQVEEGTLQVALDAWAHYLNIAEHIDIAEAGAIGITWQIIPKAGRKPRSLPEVGVGISQVLPILVMGLLSPANCLLIIEQPELHLHPVVQARLGDFFVGLAKCKKQCLIETHSENLVSQLRLHIVESGGLEKSDCMVYFVDQDEQGAAKFEKIEISPNGNILNWPDGFFDETMLQEDRITAASLKKRAQKTQPS